MKIEIVITGLKPDNAKALKKAMEGTKLHYSWNGVGDGYIEEIRMSDNRNIDADELTEIIEALRAVTWKVEGMGGDAL